MPDPVVPDPTGRPPVEAGSVDGDTAPEASASQASDAVSPPPPPPSALAHELTVRDWEALVRHAEFGCGLTTGRDEDLVADVLADLVTGRFDDRHVPPGSVIPFLKRVLEFEARNRIRRGARRTVERCFLEGWSTAEAAKADGVRAATIRKRLERARRKLRSELQRYRPP